MDILKYNSMYNEYKVEKLSIWYISKMIHDMIILMNSDVSFLHAQAQNIHGIKECYNVTIIRLV